ncbi:hypothetical protein ACS0TY_019224 [Phlomoides rotata]
MASFLQRIILVTLVLTIAIPISIGHKEKSNNKSDLWGDDSEPDIDCGDDPESDIEDSEVGRYLKDICSDTENPKHCWKIIKPEISRFTDTDSRNFAGIIVDLAIEKSCEIKNQLDQLNQESTEDALKVKYGVCINNYNDAKQSLQIAKGNINSGGDCGDISAQVDNVKQDLKNCEEEFLEGSLDPALIRDRNNEFEHYVEIVRAATNRFLREKEGNNVSRKNQSN